MYNFHFIILCFLFVFDSIENYYINCFSLKQTNKKEKILLDNIESIDYNNLESNIQNTKLFISEKDDKYLEVNDFADNSINYREIINNHSFAEIPEKLIFRYENKYQLEKRFKIIRSIENSKNINSNSNQNSYNINNKENDNNNFYKNIIDGNSGYFSEKHNFYGNKKILNLEYHYYWYYLIRKNTIINNLHTSHIKELISTEPENIIIKEKICFPHTKLVYIYNPDSEDNLLIKDIKCDLYQVQIYPYLAEDYSGTKREIYSTINNYFPYNIFPQTKFVFQLLILPDLIGDVKGNIYIKFNDKNVLMIPITITGIENEYKIKPIYNMNIQLHKQLTLPLKITNPDDKKLLMVNDIMYSFSSNIEVELRNKIKILENMTTFNPSLFKVEPNASINILYLRYFPTKVGNEHGFIFLKINNDTDIVIPLIINVEHYELNIFPMFINFGICEVKAFDRKNFIKVVPLLVINYGQKDFEIKKLYFDIEDKFLHFQKIALGENSSNKIIIPKHSHKIFGYLIFDGKYYIHKDKSMYLGQIKEGTIYLETNSTVNQLIGIDYFYMTDYNYIIKITNGYIQNVDPYQSKDIFSLEMLYRPQTGFKFDLNIVSEKLEIYKDNLNSEKITKQYKDLRYNIDFNVNINRNEKKYIYSPYIINDRLYTIVPFEVNNNNIQIAIFNNSINNFSLSSCISDTNICSIYTLKKNKLNIESNYDFGSINGEVNRVEYMYVINNNLYPIYINKIKSNNNNFSIDLENYYSLDKNSSTQYYDLSLKGKIPRMIQKYNSVKNETNYDESNMNLIIYPKTAMLLSMNIKVKKNIDNDDTINGKIYLYINKTLEVIITNHVKILLGDFSISPSNIKFGPSFLGITQSKKIFCINTYKFPLNIDSVISSDSSFIPSLLTKRVIPGNKTPIINIVFDPDVNSSIRNYKSEIDMKKSLTFNELYLWKKNEEYWNELGQNGHTEISADIKVITRFKTKVINIRSFLKKPNLLKKEEVDFGLIQVGHFVEKYIEGHNPSDSILELKVLLAPEYYNDFEDFSMFNIKEQKDLFLDKNNIVTLLNCNFMIKKNNNYQNFYEYILIKENINIENNFTNRITKEELIKKIFYYGNKKVKNYVYNSINIFCSYEKKDKNDILLIKNSLNKRLMKDLISSDFKNEIDIVKNMTCNKDYKINHQQSSSNIFSKFFSKIYSFFFPKKEEVINFEIKESKQSFYLQENISQNIYHIPPHQNFTIGPIIFKPNNKGKVVNTLLLKNNLTILYPVKIRGEGGNGEITFLNYVEDSKFKRTDIFNNTNFIIEINRDIYENKMKYRNNLTRTLIINNSGNLPLIIKSITIDGNECQTDDFKIIHCNEFLIDVGESIEMNFEITINFNNYITNKVVKFQTEYQVFELNVIIIISKDLYEQKMHLWHLSKILFFIIIPTLISFYVFQKLFYSNNIMNKRENTKISGGHIESANKFPVIKEIIENKNEGKKKTKNKKNKNKKNNMDKNNRIIKNEKIMSYKTIKTVYESNENKNEKLESKTFGVICINKDKNNIKPDKEREKSKRDISVLNKMEVKNKEIMEKPIEEIKEKKIIKIQEKNIKENEEINNKNINIQNEKDNQDNIISYEYSTRNNNQMDINNDSLNKNINQLINSNNNISNNINIKININLTSKSNNNDSEEGKDINESNNDKIIEENVIKETTLNENNYNYDIKISKDLMKDKSNIKISSKNKVTSKKFQNVKKASTLKELLESQSSKKKSTNSKKKSSNKNKIKEKEISKIPESQSKEEIKNIEIKEDEKIIKIIDEEKNNSNENMNINDMNNINNENNNDDELEEIDFNLDSIDIFNTDKNKENIEGENEAEIEDDENLPNFYSFNDHIFGQLYDNPFCTEEKEGQLEKLLKK